MLWTAIFEFFVKYVFGGVLFGNNSTSYYRGYILGGYIYGSSTPLAIDTTSLSVTIFGQQLPIGNYFSFIATIISISIIVVLCCLFVYKIIKLIGGLIR